MNSTSFVMAHVGQSHAPRRNLRHGVETCTWGLRKWKPEYRSRRPRFAVLATGVGPRTSQAKWLTQRITLYLFEICENFYEGKSLHWPDEEDEGTVKYPVRFGIQPLAVIRDTPLDDKGPLPTVASDALRLSGTRQGSGLLCEFDPEPLLKMAHMDVNQVKGQPISLGVAPGFGPEDVDVPKGFTAARRSENAASPGWVGTISDPAKRKAIEMYAENMAAAHYENLGWTVKRLGKPYDLHCTRDGEERRVEVKGTTGSAAKVLLTSNEVDHARNTQHTVDLYVVGDIRIEGKGHTASEGRVLHFKDWSPAEEDLKPKSFEYRLPLGDSPLP
ncbi:DUF3883 domain-containing protein [Streptomyces sp. NPDC101181]|uniref:DUF3883 domain-containing protein n=1 Tax=Streptomyces sp. NPDC101181 TaxID=3366125 RepID=UPI00381A1A33